MPNAQNRYCFVAESITHDVLPEDCVADSLRVGSLLHSPTHLGKFPQVLYSFDQFPGYPTCSIGIVLGDERAESNEIRNRKLGIDELHSTPLGARFSSAAPHERSQS